MIYWLFPLFIFYMEIMVKISCFGEATWKGMLYTALFSASIGFACILLVSLWMKKTNWIVARILMGILVLFCAAQIVYYQIFETFGTLYSLYAGIGAIAGFWSGTVTGILSSLPPLLALIIPYGIFLLFGRAIIPDKVEGESTKRPNRRTALLLAGTLGFYSIAFLLIQSSTGGILSIRYLYRDAFIPSLSVSNFGVLTTLRLDAENLLFHDLGDETGEPEPDKPDPDHPAPVEEYGYNVTEIDFDRLIADEADETIKDMHAHFSGVEPTRKNEYTAMFQGKNLIWIVGEGFSTLALNENTTPTLCRMAREGFVFKNFYNPVWSVSTSDGEYVTLNSLIPKSGVWSFKESAKNVMPYGFGNLLTPLGYTCNAYHDHYYKYYGRNLSHPNLGYRYKGLGNGLDVTETWPESDLQMMQLTVPTDIQTIPFHTYYMTVSGHLNYTFYGNAMAARHREMVENLPYSDACKAYLACNVELDLAMGYLLDQLEEAGLLEDTVIVLSGDHYPYGLTDEQMDELAGKPLEKTFERFKSTLIIWSGSIKEPIPVEKVCSSLDVMPTLANLFGIDYDSRLIIGQDILSESPGLVEFNDRSFVTDLGRYNAKEDSFTPAEGKTVPDGYARELFQKVNESFEYSAKILEQDYYRYLFPAY